MKRVLFVILMAGLILAACASAQPTTPITGTWDIISYGPTSNPTPTLLDISRSIIFSADGKFSGNVGCNSFSGTYTLTDGKITFQQTASTKLACTPDAIMQQEQATLRVLNGSVDLKIEGRHLTITNNEETITMEFGDY